MSIHSEHDESEHPAYSSGSVVQWLMMAAIVLSGVAVTATWFYLRW
jgi:hypothetical protein